MPPFLCRQPLAREVLICTISTSGLEKILVRCVFGFPNFLFKDLVLLFVVFTFDLRIEFIFSHNWSISQDEAGTAAIKTVELDAVLGGRAVQHRELQGHESDKFLSYFKPCIIPLEGGVATGFKKAEEEAFEIRLYVCRGKRVVRLKQVSPYQIS